MPEEQEQQPGPVEADQQAQLDGLNRRRELERGALRNQAADNYPQTADNYAGEEGSQDDDEVEEQGEQSQEQSRQPASLQTYFLFGCFAFLIDVVIDLVGGFIFSSPITFALGIVFKVPAYFILTSGGKREKLVAKRVVMMVCAIFGFLPGDSLAAVGISCFIDYKDKITKSVGKVAALTGRKDIATAAKVLERGSGLMDRARGLDQRDHDRQVQESGGRWRPSQLQSGNLPGVAAAGNSQQGARVNQSNQGSNQQNKLGGAEPYRKYTKFDIPENAEYKGNDFAGYQQAKANVSRERYEESKRQYEADKVRSAKLSDDTKRLGNREGWVQPVGGWGQNSDQQSGRDGAEPFRKHTKFDIPEYAEYKGDNYDDYMNARAQSRYNRSKEEYEAGNKQFEKNNRKAAQLSEKTKQLGNRDGWVRPGAEDGKADNGQMNKAA